ncbi:MAG: hypothetical protein DRI80_06885 [Chloroflexota bacterium]|nr:MAG: hypothetical protein DRI80_06885 [Chloroflexota bacterium]
MGMSLAPNVQTPEMASWVREIAHQVFREQAETLRKEIRQDELRSLERSLNRQIEQTWQAIRSLTEQVAALTEAQKRAEERLEGVENRLEGVENRLERLEVIVAELAEAQKRTEEQVAQLAATQRRVLERLDVLDHRVGLIGDVLGIEAEGEAEETLVYVLEQKGYRLLEAPCALSVDGEIDVVVRAETPDGEPVWVLVDVKARARLKELRRWSGRLRDPAFQQRLAEAGVVKPFLPYFFGLRVYQIVDDEAHRLGIGVLDPNGERVEPTLLR